MTAVRAAAERRPVLFAVALAILLTLFSLVSKTVFGRGLSVPRLLAGEAVLDALALALVGSLGWWERTGLTSPLRPSWLLLALGGVVAFYSGVAALASVRLGAPLLLPAIPLALMVGFAEEALARGLVLELLRPLGLLTAAAGSALFFGLLHLNNLLLAFSPSVLAQALYAALLGLFLAAVRIRVGSLWPLVVAHGLIDLPSLAAGRFVPAPLPNPWLVLVWVLVALPWGAAGIGIVIDERRRQG